MPNQAFNTYLNSVKPIANQGAGRVTALLRTVGSGASFAKRKAVNYKHITLPAALGAAASIATLYGVPGASGVAQQQIAKAGAALESTIRQTARNAVGNVPFAASAVNALVNSGMRQIKSIGPGATQNQIKQVVANAANKLISGAPNSGVPPGQAPPAQAALNKAALEKKVNRAVELYVRQQKMIGNVNYANVFNYRQKVRKAIINGTFDPNKATRQFNAATVKGQKIGAAIAGGALLAEAMVASGLGGRIMNLVSKKPSLPQGVTPATIPQKVKDLKYLEQLLQMAQKGQHVIGSPAVNRAVQMGANIGLDPTTLMHALESGGQVAQQFLQVWF